MALPLYGEANGVRGDRWCRCLVVVSTSRCLVVVLSLSCLVLFGVGAGDTNVNVDTIQ